MNRRGQVCQAEKATAFGGGGAMTIIVFLIRSGVACPPAKAGRAGLATRPEVSPPSDGL